MQRELLLRSVAMVLCLGLAAGSATVWKADPAWAQDDDDDGGDDGDDGDDGGDDDGSDDGGSDDDGSYDDGGDDDDDGADDGDEDGDDDGNGNGVDAEGGGTGGAVGSGGDQSGATGGQAQPRRIVAPPPEPPRRVEGELVSISLTDADLAALVAQGFRVLDEQPVPEIGIVSRRLAIPAGSTLDAARDLVRALPSGADADFNHYYRTEEAAEPAVCEGLHCATMEQIGWSVPATTLASCGATVLIGMIDTGINPDHDTFEEARLDVHRLSPESLDPSSAIHGTAVLSLIIGNPESRSPGLLPKAQVVAVDAFHSVGQDERADVYTLTAAMDFLADRGVRVINMSLAGPPNSVLEAATAALIDRGVIIVAAVGNGGPKSDPAYPAAYPGVIGVTAVDAGDTVYRRAGQGPHVDLAAPGVEVWTAASVSGARPKTGTSFAAPFVTAAVASVLEQKPDLDADALIVELASAARDLGDTGRDDVYGFGLLQAPRRCGP